MGWPAQKLREVVGGCGGGWLGGENDEDFGSGTNPRKVEAGRGWIWEDPEEERGRLVGWRRHEGKGWMRQLWARVSYVYIG